MEERIGISGWRYRPWKGKFYPGSLSPEDELHFVSRNLNSVELNGSFYALQKPESYKKWHKKTEDDFVFSVKGSRYITHVRRLREVKTPLANFFSSGVLLLQEKLGPFLWQFPPNMKLDMEKMKTFIEVLPKTFCEARSLALRHDKTTSGRASMKVQNDAILRHAIEPRNISFDRREFYELLKENNIALVVSDSDGKWPLFEEVTADFVYVRLHGNKKVYEGGYPYQTINAWKRKVARWEENGLDIYLYFDNDVKVHAPFNAMYLYGQLTGHKSPDFGRDEILKHCH